MAFSIAKSVNTGTKSAFVSTHRRDVSSSSSSSRVKTKAAASSSSSGPINFDSSSQEELVARAKKECPVCRGTGYKACGQCGGTGVNQEDLFQGKFKKGDACWLCGGKHGSKTMCGNCIDLTDSF